MKIWLWSDVKFQNNILMRSGCYLMLGKSRTRTLLKILHQTPLPSVTHSSEGGGSCASRRASSRSQRGASVFVRYRCHHITVSKSPIASVSWRASTSTPDRKYSGNATKPWYWWRRNVRITQIFQATPAGTGTTFEWQQVAPLPAGGTPTGAGITWERQSGWEESLQAGPVRTGGLWELRASPLGWSI